MAQTGVFKFFNESKGYGFIKPDDGGKDVFCHVTALPNDNTLPSDGTRVRFDVVPDKKGSKAANVVWA